MKSVLLLAVLLCAGCSQKPVSVIIPDNKPHFPSITDTLMDSGGRLVLLQFDSIQGLSLATKNGSFNYTINLDKENIPYKLMPDLQWTNDDYAFVMTTWSQAQCRTVFLPMKAGRKFIYLNKDIEETDSVYNNVVYVDTVYKNSVIFAVENLTTRKNKKVSAIINQKNWLYPYYDTIRMTNNQVVIKTNIEQFEIDIKDLD
jgi:hypothetical protein